MILYRQQCRGARAMLDISRDVLAERAHVSVRTVADFESGSRQPIPATLAALRRALEDAGIEFIDATGDQGVGVRFRRAGQT